ncbi:hypothetical protein LTR66_010228 [Elasticomyces elasticus]|nr:hypothetical protein LTR66_010228 [Elasticomyces elasticus]
MSFLGNIVNELTHQGGQRREEYGQRHGEYGQHHGEYGQQSYGGGSGYNQGPPQCPPPWVARWDEADRRWIYINERTSERTFEFPGNRYGGGGGGGDGYPRQEYYEGRPQGGQYYEGRPQGGRYYEEERREKRGGHGMAYGAAGAAAGLAGGALLMHEGEHIRRDWDEDKYRMENSIGNGINDVEEFPENAAEWTGRKVQDVEDIPQDIEHDFERAKYGIENRFDNVVQDVEDVPEDVAGWAGDKVGDVERFDDNVDNAYERGRYEGRNDDDW